MNVADIIRIVSNRLDALRSQRTLAISIGDLEQVATIDSQITETQTTLDQLRTLV